MCRVQFPSLKIPGYPSASKITSNTGNMESMNISVIFM